MGEGENMVAATESPVSKAGHWKISRGFRLERWRLVTRFRVYHGLGYPQFEFTLCIGRKRRERVARGRCAYCYGGWVNGGSVHTTDCPNAQRFVSRALDTADCPQSAPPASPSSEVSDG